MKQQLGNDRKEKEHLFFYDKSLYCLLIFELKQKAFFTLFLLSLQAIIFAQDKGRSWKNSAGISVPAGTFSATHWSGISIQGEYSRNRFGKTTIKPKKLIDYILSTGTDYYFGRKETVSSYPFTYTGYFILNSNAGLIFNTGRQSNVRIGAGPAISLYKKNLRFNISSAVAGSWYLSKNTGITGGLQKIQETGARPLRAVFIRLSKAF